MNLFNIENSFNDLKTRGWDRLYWFVDFHGTVAVADYGDETKKRTFYPYAKETLQFLTKVDEICLVLWTCSHRDDITDMTEWLLDNYIKFDYINENPECVTSERVNLDQKPYYNVMLEDRAGLEPEDWKDIYELVTNHYIKD